MFVAGASNHVYCRVVRGEWVCADPREAAALVGVIREVVREHGLSVLAWCVMPTHYHLAVRAGRLPLWRSMRLIQGRFARLHNRRRRVLGPFWQGRYKAIVVPDERYLMQLVAYIHLNPVTAKVVIGTRYHHLTLLRSTCLVSSEASVPRLTISRSWRMRTSRSD